jgi:hypothetical protein
LPFAFCNSFEPCRRLLRRTASPDNLRDPDRVFSANYRSARRSRSRKEFIARLGIVVDEADESEHWLALLKKAGLSTGVELDWLLRESGELRAIFVKSLGTARANNQILKS